MTAHLPVPGIEGAVPYGRTAVRPTWSELPLQVRQAIAGRLGQHVVHTDLAGGGFTRGFAGRVVGVDGGQAFVKATGPEPAEIAASYRREAEVLRALPAGMPVPTLLWSAEVETGSGPWVVLASAMADGTMPGGPWDATSLRRVLDAVSEASERATLAELTLPVGDLAEDLAGELGTLAYWPEVASRTRPAPCAWAARRAPLLATLAQAAPASVAGESVLHGDVRADNVVMGVDRVWICDWNWVSRGAAWVDYVALLAQARSQGVPVHRVLQGDEVWERATADEVSSLLAWLSAFMLLQSEAPSPAFASPWLRRHQRQAADEFLQWLQDRLERPG